MAMIKWDGLYELEISTGGASGGHRDATASSREASIIISSTEVRAKLNTIGNTSHSVHFRTNRLGMLRVMKGKKYSSYSTQYICCTQRTRRVEDSEDHDAVQGVADMSQVESSQPPVVKSKYKKA